MNQNSAKKNAANDLDVYVYSYRYFVCKNKKTKKKNKSKKSQAAVNTHFMNDAVKLLILSSLAKNDHFYSWLDYQNRCMRTCVKFDSNIGCVRRTKWKKETDNIQYTI